MSGLSTFLKGVYYGRYDKTVHFTASAALTFFALYIWGSLMVLPAIVLLGIAKEIRDMMRPGDHFDWYDITTNIIGVGGGYLLWRMLIH
jgi:hypothetical protein